MVAFANTAGGAVLIGVEDESRYVRAVHEPFELEERLANLISDLIVPDSCPNSIFLPWRRTQILAVQVHPSPSCPYCLKREGLEPPAGRRARDARALPGPGLRPLLWLLGDVRAVGRVYRALASGHGNAGKTGADLSVYGQESNYATWQLAWMDLAIRRIEHEIADIAGFCTSATVEEIRKHGHVLTPGRCVGAEAQEDDGQPFKEKITRLVATLHE